MFNNLAIKNNPIIFSLVLFVFIFLISMYVTNGGLLNFDYGNAAVYCVLFLFAINLFLNAKTHGYFRVISFSFLFPFSFMIVYFQIAILELLGIEMGYLFDYFIWFDRDLRSEILTVAALGLAAYTLGLFVTVNLEKQVNKGINLKYQTIKILSILCVASYIIFFLSAGNYRLGIYDNYASTSAFTRYAIRLFELLILPALACNVFYIVKNHKNVKDIFSYLGLFYRPLLLITLFNILFSLYVGDRGPVMSYTLLLLSGYIIYMRKISALLAIGALIIGSIAFSFIYDIRTRTLDSSYYERASEAFSQSSGITALYYANLPEDIYIPNTVELSLSVRTLSHVIGQVPEEYPYKYGHYSFQNLIAVIPGAAGVYNRVVYDGDFKYDGSAIFLSLFLF